MIRYVVGFVLGIALVLVTVACMPSAGAENRTQTIDLYQEQVRTLSDGRKVLCLVHETGYGYAVTCDWARAK